MQIIHDIDISREQIRQLNVCRLFKRITFLSEIIDHNLQGFMPDLWHPDKKSYVHCQERFPNVKVPKRYWELWRNIMSTIRASHRIQITSIGAHRHLHHTRWLTTIDQSSLLQDTTEGHKVYKLERVHRNKYYYSKKEFMTKKLEFFDNYIYVTPTISEMHKMVYHVDQIQSVSLDDMASIRRHMENSFYQTRVAIKSTSPQ